MPQCDQPNCCLSQSSCLHAGPHSFCDKHKEKSVPQGMGYGWICPVCGSGLSPYATICHCQSPPMTVTCGKPVVDGFWNDIVLRNGFIDLDFALKMQKE